MGQRQIAALVNCFKGVRFIIEVNFIFKKKAKRFSTDAHASRMFLTKLSTPSSLVLKGGLSLKRLAMIRNFLVRCVAVWNRMARNFHFNRTWVMHHDKLPSKMVCSFVVVDFLRNEASLI